MYIYFGVGLQPSGSFIGPPGCGKTSLIQSLFLHYGIKQIPTYSTSPQLTDRQYYSPLLLTYSDLFSKEPMFQNDLECILLGNASS